MNIHIKFNRLSDSAQYTAYYWVDGFTPDEHPDYLHDYFYGDTDTHVVEQIVAYLVRAGYTPKIMGVYKE